MNISLFTSQTLIALMPIFLPFLTFFLFSILCMPLICLKNRRLAHAKKLSLYTKSAFHLSKPTAFLFIFFGLAFLADYFAKGFIMQSYVIPRFYEIPFIILISSFLTIGLLFSFTKKMPKTLQSIIFYLVALASLTLMYIATIALSQELTILWFMSEITNTLTFLNETHHEIFSLLFFSAIMFLFYLTLGLYGAHYLSMFYLILRRNKDDFGRDYYNTLMTSHVSRAAVSGLFLCIIILAIMYFVPNAFIVMQKYIIVSTSTLLETFRNIPEQVSLQNITQNTNYISFILSLVLLIPVSIILLKCIEVSSKKGKSPMQKKSFIFIGYILFLFGITVFLPLCYS